MPDDSYQPYTSSEVRFATVLGLLTLVITGLLFLRITFVVADGTPGWEAIAAIVLSAISSLSVGLFSRWAARSRPGRWACVSALIFLALVAGILMLTLLNDYNVEIYVDYVSEKPNFLPILAYMIVAMALVGFIAVVAAGSPEGRSTFVAASTVAGLIFTFWLFFNFSMGGVYQSDWELANSFLGAFALAAVGASPVALVTWVIVSKSNQD